MPPLFLGHSAPLPVRQACAILRFRCTVVPNIASPDKFLHLLLDWNQYLPAMTARHAGGHTAELVFAAGVNEIFAGRDLGSLSGALALGRPSHDLD